MLMYVCIVAYCGRSAHTRSSTCLTIVTGWISDRLFQGRRGPPNVLFLCAAVVTFFATALSIDSSNYVLDCVLMLFNGYASSSHHTSHVCACMHSSAHTRTSKLKHTSHVQRTKQQQTCFSHALSFNKTPLIGVNHLYFSLMSK